MWPKLDQIRTRVQTEVLPRSALQPRMATLKSFSSWPKLDQIRRRQTTLVKHLSSLRHGKGTYKLFAAWPKLDQIRTRVQTQCHPLYIAAQNGHIEVVRFLTEAGSDKEKANNTGETPLFIAAQQGHIEMVQFLTDAGSDKDKADDSGETPLFICSTARPYRNCSLVDGSWIRRRRLTTLVKHLCSVQHSCQIEIIIAGSKQHCHVYQVGGRESRVFRLNSEYQLEYSPSWSFVIELRISFKYQSQMSLPNQLRCYFFWLMFSVSIANLQKNTWTDLRHMHEVAPTTFSCGVIVCGILARCTWCCAKIGVHTVFLLARVVFPRKLGKRDVVPETKHNFSQKIVGTIFGNMTKKQELKKILSQHLFPPQFSPKNLMSFQVILHFVQIWLGVQGCPSQRPSVFSGVFFF